MANKKIAGILFLGMVILAILIVPRRELTVSIDAGPSSDTESIENPQITYEQEIIGRLNTPIENSQNTLIDEIRQGIVIDQEIYVSLVDVYNLILKGIDNSENLNALEAYGIASENDGEFYSVDRENFPGWTLLQDHLIKFYTLDNFEVRRTEMLNHGLSLRTIESIRIYISEHSIEVQLEQVYEEALLEFNSQLEIDPTFSRNDQEFENIEDSALEAVNEIKRDWAFGLLNILDDDEKNLFVSYLSSEPRTTKIYPSSN